MNEHNKGIDYFRKGNKCDVNKPPRPVGTGKRLTGGSAATERRKIGETKEKEYCNRSFS